MRRRILILLVLVGLGFGLYSLGKFILNLSQRPQNTSSTTPQEQNSQTTAQAKGLSDDIFEINKYTPQSYRPPNFDPFSNKYRTAPDYHEVLGPSQEADTPPTGTFVITSQKQGFGDQVNGSLEGGTVNTEFIFRANSLLDKETSYDRLQVRWDFDGDGVPDTFFSRTKAVRHTYDKTGTYNVTMQILDGGGNVVTVIHHFKVVENTNPTAYFTYSPTSGTPATIFTFNTQLSSDSQFLRNSLDYRFDWDSDGKWDTNYEKKTIWKHMFTEVGTHHVTMEARDPDGLLSQATADIAIFENTPPVANFKVLTQKLQNGKTLYIFDASASNDAETPLKNLLFRWDFNYTGENDIVFDSNFSTADITSGSYDIPGKKTIRLQVKDQDGVVSEAFATIDVVN